MKKIKEIIVVEGRDDTCAIKQAVDAETIETHGFGIEKKTWELIDKAYNSNGIIVFTDPDRAGEEIRRRIMSKYPKAKEAFLTRKQAMSEGDIGIENANPEDIEKALEKVCCAREQKDDESVFTMTDLVMNGLTGEGSKKKRENLGKALGIGYGNSSAFLRKLNKYGITKEEFLRKLE